MQEFDKLITETNLYKSTKVQTHMHTNRNTDREARMKNDVLFEGQGKVQ